jgi:hypothetical protein
VEATSQVPWRADGTARIPRWSRSAPPYANKLASRPQRARRHHPARQRTPRTHHSSRPRQRARTRPWYESNVRHAVLHPPEMARPGYGCRQDPRNPLAANRQDAHRTAISRNQLGLPIGVPGFPHAQALPRIGPQGDPHMDASERRESSVRAAIAVAEEAVASDGSVESILARACCRAAARTTISTAVRTLSRQLRYS